MKHSHRLALTAFVGASLLALVACGGGGGAAPSAASTLIGTAATGAAVANAVVTVRDRGGASTVCTNDSPVMTNESGAYTCTLSAQSQAPFVVGVTDPAALVDPMVSIVANKPAPGASATANVTPLTTAIAAQLNAGDAFAAIRDPGTLASLNLASLSAITANVVAQLAPVLQAAGIDPARFDPARTPFVGGSGAGADQILDQVRVTFDGGVPYLSNVLNAAAPPVPMAGTVSSGIATVAVPSVTGTFSFSELDFAKTELERCFSVPVALRAPNPDTANRRLQGVASECQNFVASAGDAPNVDIDFLNNGYSAETYFYSLFTSEDMDGARFNRPELMRYVTRADGRDEAVLNIKFQDKSGFSGNRILVAKKFPGSRTGGTQWWLVGNQRPIDAFIVTSMTRREQTIPQSVLDSSTAYDEVPRSRYDVGLQIFIHRPNNGGTVNNPNNPNNALRYVRVTGPGLPTAGLVFGDLAAVRTQNSMSFLNNTGSIPSAVTSTQQFASDIGNIFRLQRTVGIDGADATALRGNPGVWSALEADRQINWAHPRLYGENVDSAWRFDAATVPAWSLYTFEAFCGSGTTPCHTFTSRIVTPLTPATALAHQPWHSFTPASRAYVLDGAAATKQVDVAWNVNPLAQRIGSVSVGSNIAGAGATVPVGSFSQTVLLGSGVFPALSIGDLSDSRQMKLRYQTLDGTYKEQDLRFN